MTEGGQPAGELCNWSLEWTPVDTDDDERDGRRRSRARGEPDQLSRCRPTHPNKDDGGCLSLPPRSLVAISLAFLPHHLPLNSPHLSLSCLPIMPPKDTSPPVAVVQVSAFYDGQTVRD